MIVGILSPTALTDSFAKAKLSVMVLLEVAQVAARMGVSPRQVQNLVAEGALHSLARGVIDEASVERHLATRGESPRRPWLEATAWGAVALLSGHEATWVGGSQRSRLRVRLRMLRAGELVGRARGRAVVMRFAGHASTVTRLRDDVVDTARAAEALGLAATTALDGYVAANKVGALIRRHGLARDDDGRIALRVTGMDLSIVAQLAQESTVLAALDLAESLDVRERRIGRDALEDALERFRA